MPAKFSVPSPTGTLLSPRCGIQLVELSSARDQNGPFMCLPGSLKRYCSVKPFIDIVTDLFMLLLLIQDSAVLLIGSISSLMMSPATH